MTKKLTLTRGLPASGKSFWSKVEAQSNGAVVFNKDNIRQELHDGVWTKDNEKITIETERQRVTEAINRGCDYIIVDNTHLGHYNSHVSYYRKLAGEYGYQFHIKDFSEKLSLLLDRDEHRGEDSVGWRVIMDMYEKYGITHDENIPYIVQDKNNKSAYIFDIDGTLAFKGERDPYDFSRVHEDKVNEPIAYILSVLNASSYDIIIVSGRGSECRGETEKWLEDNGIIYHSLFMRQEGDNRPDDVVKKEIAEVEILPYYNVKGVFDDRDKVVKMWRSIGLPCMQVAYGNF